ncbi:MAG: hypothetical protein LH615_03755, partial [Ferruginibacter sp.]|nr:hypothetical protein [Ferruginibacter sp.]
MGVSIHYSGKLKSAALLPPFLEEVKDIVTILGWTYNEFIGTYADDIFEPLDTEKDYGISVAAPHCEPMVLIFDFEGNIYVPWLKQYFEDKSFYYTVHCKTQFAGADVHIKVVELLRYLSNKYFSIFELYDEAEYWETKNKKTVEEKIEFLDKKTAQFAEGIFNTAMKEGESMEDYL